MDQGNHDAGLSRRRMLQAAVAGGVGAAAWTAPQIKTLGFKPAYAAVCSSPATVTTYYSTRGDVGCPQAALTHSASLHDTLTFGSADEYSVKVSGNKWADGVNAFTVEATGVRVLVRSVEVWDLNGVQYDSWPVDPGDPQLVPVVGQAGGTLCQTSMVLPHRYQWSVTVDTVPEGECFPGEVI